VKLDSNVNKMVLISLI